MYLNYTDLMAVLFASIKPLSAVEVVEVTVEAALEVVAEVVATAAAEEVMAAAEVDVTVSLINRFQRLHLS